MNNKIVISRYCLGFYFGAFMGTGYLFGGVFSPVMRLYGLSDVERTLCLALLAIVASVTIRVAAEAIWPPEEAPDGHEC